MDAHLCGSAFTWWIFAAGVNIPQTNTIPLLVVSLSMEKLPLLKTETAVFQTFLPISNWIQCCFGPLYLTWFDTNFFKRSNFPYAFAMSSPGSLDSGGEPCPYYDSIGLDMCQTPLTSIWAAAFCVWYPVLQSLRLSPYHLAWCSR